MGKIVLQDSKGNKVILLTDSAIEIKHHPKNVGMTVLDKNCTLISLDPDPGVCLTIEESDLTVNQPEAFNEKKGPEKSEDDPVEMGQANQTEKDPK